MKDDSLFSLPYPQWVKDFLEQGPYPCDVCRTPASVPMPGQTCEACKLRERQSMQQAKVNAAINSIPDEPRAWSWDQPGLADLCGGRERVASARRAFARAVADRLPAIVLIGAAGTGKSTLAACMLRDAITGSAQDTSSRWVDAFDLGRAYRVTDLGDTPVVVATAKRAGVLVIDELGSEDCGRDTLHEVIHHRHARRKLTIVTTPLDRDGLAAKYGEGLARRLLERGIVLDLNPSNVIPLRRGKNAQAA